MKNIFQKFIRIIRLNVGFKPINIEAYFVVSTGRTGTLFFETFFKEVMPNSLSLHEPKPDLFNISIEKIRNGRASNAVIKYITRKRRILLQEKGEIRKLETYIECNPFMSFILDEMKKAFPKAKFIIITRDAKSYVKSALNKSPNNDDKMFMYGEDDHRKRPTPLDFKGDKYQDNWIDFNRIEKISWYWNKCNIILLEFLKLNPEKAMHVSFERIFTDDIEMKMSEVQKILKFVNVAISEERLGEILSVFDQKKNNTNSIFFEGFEQWNTTDQINFEKLTEPATKLINQLLKTGRELQHKNV